VIRLQRGSLTKSLFGVLLTSGDWDRPKSRPHLVLHPRAANMRAQRRASARPLECLVRR